MLWQKGNDYAFATLYKRYVLKLISIALSKVHNRDDAEELVQNTFLKFYQHKETLKDIKSVFAYLYVILKNQVFNFHHSQLVRQRYEQKISAAPEPADLSLNSLLEIKDLEKQIDDAISNLPERCREVFLLKRKEDLSNKQIAQTLNISENTVEQHMRKALSRLRAALGKYFIFIFLMF